MKKGRKAKIGTKSRVLATMFEVPPPPVFRVGAKPELGELIALLLKAISEKYPTTGTQPGLVLSFLGNGGAGPFYGPVRTYISGLDRVVVKHTATGATLAEVVENLARAVAVQGDSACCALGAALAR